MLQCNAEAVSIIPANRGDCCFRIGKLRQRLLTYPARDRYGTGRSIDHSIRNRFRRWPAACGAGRDAVRAVAPVQTVPGGDLPRLLSPCVQGGGGRLPASRPPATRGYAADASQPCPNPNSWTLSVLSPPQISSDAANSVHRRRSNPAEGYANRDLVRQTAVCGQAKQSIVEERARSQLMPCLLRFWFTAVAKWVPVHPVGRKRRPHRRGPASLDQRRDRPLLIVIGEQKVNRAALLATRSSTLP